MEEKEEFSLSEMGLILSGFKFGEKKISIINNNIYFASLLLLDLYNDNILEFYIQVGNLIISLKKSEESAFSLLENMDQRQIIQNLLLKPLRSRLPNNYPEQYKILYNEIIKQSLVYNNASYIQILDLLVASQCDLFINLTINDCKAYLISQLVEKNILLVSRKFYLFFDYNLTDKGLKLTTFAAEQCNQYLQNTYVKEEAFYKQFDSPSMQKKLYTLSQLLLILPYSSVTKATRISKQTQNKAFEMINAIVSQLGNVVRSPDLKMQPADQESWYVAMISLMVKCMDKAILKASQQ